MKFGKWLEQAKVAEWKDKYVKYKALKKQIKEIKENVIRMCKFYSELPALTENAPNPEIAENVQMVDEFYNRQLQTMLDQFHSLVLLAVQLKLIKEYIPKGEEGQGSRLERELARLPEVKSFIKLITSEETRQKKDPESPRKELHRPLGKLADEENGPSLPISIVKRIHTSEQIRSTTLDLLDEIIQDESNKPHESPKENDVEKPLPEGELKEGLRQRPKVLRGIVPENWMNSQKALDANVDALKESRKTPIRKKYSFFAQLNPKENETEVNSIEMKNSGTISKTVPHITKKQLEHAFTEFYRGLALLQSYGEVNLEAISKVVKKHHKEVGGLTKDEYIKAHVSPLSFTKKAEVKHLTLETERVFSEAFTKGHRTKAMDKLRIPVLKSTGISSFRLGVFTGITLILFLVMIYLKTSQQSEFERQSAVLIVYRMMGMAVLMIWFWGFNMYVWSRYRVNYVFIFDFNPRRHIRFQNMLEAASLFTVLWSISLVIYLFSGYQPSGLGWIELIPYQIHPLLLLFFYVVVFIWFQVTSKSWLLKTLLRIVTAPFHKVAFRDFFLADQLASIAIVLYDLEYSACFLLYDTWVAPEDGVCDGANTWTRPLIAMVPALWRFLQCCRRYRDTRDKWQLANAGKYTSAIFVATFSAFRGNYQSPVFLVLWLLMIIFSTAYNYYWDVARDWGLGDVRYGFLRKEKLYNRSEVYYFIMITNLVFRLMWTLTISPEVENLFSNPAVFTTILAGIEILRRALWNLLRLENEQLNNVGKYRAVDINVPLPVPDWDYT